MSTPPPSSAEAAGRRPWRVATIALGFAIALTLSWNAWHHPPEVGYDARAHLEMVDTIARGVLPSAADSHEFFSPPLPYLLPALVRALGGSLHAAGKSAQAVNLLLAIGVLALAARAAGRIGGDVATVTTLLLIGMLPVFYRSFSQLRGEPYVAFLALLLAERLAISLETGRLGRANATILFLGAGTLALARQWGLALLAGWGLLALALLFRPARRRVAAIAGAWTAAGALLLAGWFYLHLARVAGSPLATTRGATIERSSIELGLAGLADARLFREPLRPAFGERALPILYADTWGDYWAYFLVRARRPQTNRTMHGPQLGTFRTRNPEVPLGADFDRRLRRMGRIAAIALFPTLVLAAGAVGGGWSGLHRLFARDSQSGPHDAALHAVALAASLLGFAVALAIVPTPGTGDTVKATYLLHAYPLAAVLAGGAASRFARRNPRPARVLAAALVAVGLYCSPAFVTSFRGFVPGGVDARATSRLVPAPSPPSAFDTDPGPTGPATGTPDPRGRNR